MSDMYLAMRKKILWPADCLEKATKAVARLSNVQGNNDIIAFINCCIIYSNVCLIDKATQIKVLYDTKLCAFNDSEWRPDAWLSFLMTGAAAGSNALVTMVPRLDPNSLVLTQNKAVRKHAREVSRAAQVNSNKAANTHKTKGDGSIVDLTDPKVKSVKHYHYLKPEPNMDPSNHLKRKFDAINSIIDGLNRTRDTLLIEEYEKKKLQISMAILKELEKKDAAILCDESFETDLSRIDNVNDDNDDDNTWT